MKGYSIRIGRRGATLLVLGVFDLIFGSFFLDPHIHQPLAKIPIYRALQDIASLYVWGVLWLVTGFVCIWAAFREKDMLGFLAAIIIKFLWSAGLIAAWLLWDATFAWAQAALWLSLCGWVVITAGWPEPVLPPEQREKLLHQVEEEK